MKKLNLGSNKKTMEGWINLDAQDLEGVDVIHDVTELPLPFDDESIDEIYSSEFLEHIDFKMTRAVLAECYRVMKKGATMTVSCPDIEKMCEYYVNKQICECVPQKAARMEDFKADPNCEKCGGKAIINPTRWRLAFTGAGKKGKQRKTAAPSQSPCRKNSPGIPKGKSEFNLHRRRRCCFYKFQQGTYAEFQLFGQKDTAA